MRVDISVLSREANPFELGNLRRWLSDAAAAQSSPNSSVDEDDDFVKSSDGLTDVPDDIEDWDLSVGARVLLFHKGSNAWHPATIVKVDGHSGALEIVYQRNKSEFTRHVAAADIRHQVRPDDGRAGAVAGGRQTIARAMSEHANNRTRSTLSSHSCMSHASTERRNTDFWAIPAGDMEIHQKIAAGGAGSVWSAT